MKLVDDLDQSAKDIQAVNTIQFNGNKIGYNTDGFGFSHSLEEEGIILEEQNVLVIGAGGASRAILVSLINNKANVTLTNRTKQKAEDLVKELNLDIEVADYSPESLKQILEETDIIVNTTSLGMTPKVETTPIPKELLKPNHIIFDVVYNPLETQLIKDAKEKGCKTISGVNMLVHQGAQSLRIWLGIEPPTEIMKEVVLENLKN
jgi:shikimate dehydrogenase